MLDTISILIIFLVPLNIIIFGIGYIIGKLNTNISSQAISGTQSNKSVRNVSINENTQNKITIDDRKFVASISTDGIEKKYDQLGETKLTNDNINDSVNKLQNLKR